MKTQAFDLLFRSYKLLLKIQKYNFIEVKIAN
jgi:hypothetical protein